MRNSTFTRAYDTITNVIPFNPEWKNATGYLDGAVKVKLDAGQTAKSYDDFNRRIILVGTPVGTIVLFDRHTGNDNPEKENIVVVLNRPHHLIGVIDEGSQSDDDFIRIVGYSPVSNIGTVLRGLVGAANKSMAA